MYGHAALGLDVEYVPMGVYDIHKYFGFTSKPNSTTTASAPQVCTKINEEILFIKQGNKIIMLLSSQFKIRLIDVANIKSQK